jgi:hypothetical protein
MADLERCKEYAIQQRVCFAPANFFGSDTFSSFNRVLRYSSSDRP